MECREASRNRHQLLCDFPAGPAALNELCHHIWCNNSEWDLHPLLAQYLDHIKGHSNIFIYFTLAHKLSGMS